METRLETPLQAMVVGVDAFFMVAVKEAMLDWQVSLSRYTILMCKP